MTRESNLLRVHVRVSAGGGGHRSSRPHFHAHGRDAVRRPSDDRHRVRAGAHRRAEAGTARTTFGLGVGPTNIDLEWKDGKLAFAWMTQLKPTFGKTDRRRSRRWRAAIGLDAARSAARAPAGRKSTAARTSSSCRCATRKAVDAAVDRSREARRGVRAPPACQRRGIVRLHDRERPGRRDGVQPVAERRAASRIRRPDRRRARPGAFAAKYGFVPRDRGGRRSCSCRACSCGGPSRLHVRIGDERRARVTGVKVGGPVGRRRRRDDDCLTVISRRLSGFSHSRRSSVEVISQSSV